VDWVEEYCVYKHTAPNGKVYIGITRQTPYDRFSNGHGYKENEHFFRAIKLYGWDNIAHEILLENLSLEEASRAEIGFIAKYKSMEPEHGYNNTSGGCKEYVMSEGTKRKKSENSKRMWQKPEYRKAFTERMSGKNNPMCNKVFTEEDKKVFSEMGKRGKGRPMSDETKKKLSEVRKAQGNFRQGTRHTEETKQKMSQAQRARFCTTQGSVVK
jgi:hypothetical protein